MKKFLSILTGFLLLVNTFTVSAATNNFSTSDLDKMFSEKVIPHSATEVTVNEYKMLKGLQCKTDEELIELGFSLDTISNLRTLDYKQELIKRSELTSKELKNMGYSDEKIELLKSDTYNWSEKDIEERAGTLVMRMGISQVTNGNRDWYMFYTWNWREMPVFLMTDILGVSCVGSINGGMASTTISDLSTATTQYYFYDGKYATETTKNYSKVDVNLSESKFALQGKTNNLATLAKSGYGTVKFTNTEPMDKLTIRLKYGHSWYSLEPSVSIDIGGVSGGFGFSDGVSEDGNLVNAYYPDGSIVQ